jgi:hypothetical protein
MRHDPIFAYDFHGLPLRSVPGLKLSKTEFPAGSFYAALYPLVCPSEKFRASKRRTAPLIHELLAEHLAPGSLLSWGAGHGLIEDGLACRGWKVAAVETVRTSDWPDTVSWHEHLDQVAHGEFDAAMTVSTLYSQDDADCVALLQALADRLRHGGYLLLLEQDTRSLSGSLRGWVARQIRDYRRADAQFWGYLRGPAFYVENTPLEHVASRYFALNEDWTYRPIDPPARLFGRQLLTRHSRVQCHLFRKPQQGAEAMGRVSVSWRRRGSQRTM